MTQPDRHAYVIKQLLHTTCAKNFPEEFRDRTTVPEHSHAEYRRRGPQHGGRKGGITYDNRHVVPYNPYLLLK